MVRNVGKIDRMLRFVLSLFLVWLGFVPMGGLEGNVWGVFVAIIALLPLYIAFTSSCFVFKWFKVHSLSKSECQVYGHPYFRRNDEEE